MDELTNVLPICKPALDVYDGEQHGVGGEGGVSGEKTETRIPHPIQIVQLQGKLLGSSTREILDQLL